jgi:hypothetical protein
MRFFPRLRAQRISSRYSYETFPDLSDRINDALKLEDLGYTALLGVNCIQARDHVQALRDEQHDRKGEIQGLIGPLVYIDDKAGMAFAPPGRALWQTK